MIFRRHSGQFCIYLDDSQVEIAVEHAICRAGRKQGQCQMGGWGRCSLCLVVTILFAAEAYALDPISPESPRAQPVGAAFLKSLPREWSGTSDRDCKTYEDKNVDRLAQSFAMSAAAFLNAFRKVHGAVTITSAHRTSAEQECVCVGEKGPCAGRPRVIKKKKRRIVVRSISRHQLGVALDVRPGTGSEDEFICMHEFAQLNPQFGVRFPLGKGDYPHMEPAASGPNRLKLAALSAGLGNLIPCHKMKIMLTHDHID